MTDSDGGLTCASRATKKVVAVASSKRRRPVKAASIWRRVCVVVVVGVGGPVMKSRCVGDWRERKSEVPGAGLCITDLLLPESGVPPSAKASTSV